MANLLPTQFLLTISPTTKMVPVLPDIKLRILVGTTCSLSILGSLMIIVSYIGFKSLRTTPRLILVHLSIMDLGVAVANLVGISVNFNKYYFDNTNNSYKFGLPILKDPGTTVNNACITQAVFAVYFTRGSILWTISMAAYLYLRIVHHQRRQAAYRCLLATTFFSYLIPLFSVIWELVTDRLGYSPFDSEGWCGEKMVDLNTGKRQALLSFIGYDVWIIITYVLVPTLYISVLLYIRNELKPSVQFGLSQERFRTAAHNVDYKLLLIPLTFLLLRTWSFVIVIVYEYMDSELPSDVHQVLVYLAGFGDSGQGFVNSLLFVLLTKKVREKLFACNNKICYKNSTEESGPLIVKSVQGSLTYQNYSKENTSHVFFSSLSSYSSSDDRAEVIKTKQSK